MKTTFLSSKDIETIIIDVGVDHLLDNLIEKLRTGFASKELANAQIPTRSGLYYTEPDLGLLEWMPAATDNQATLKIVGYHPTNPGKRKLPTILSTLCAFDTDTGHMRGILDGTFPTALRTGAMSAVASSILTPSNRPLSLAFIGGGAQAVTQAHALSRVLNIEKIFVHDKIDGAAQSLKNRIEFLQIPVHVLSREAFIEQLPDFDLLCTCTSEVPGTGALFEDFLNKSDLHINAVGSDFPEKFELPHALLKRAFVCPDFLEQAFIEGECQQLKRSDVSFDLAALLTATKKQQEEFRNGLTVFDSTGHAYADFIATEFFLQYAEDLGLGSQIELESVPDDPLNPYSFLSSSNFKTHFSPPLPVSARENGL
ncbi:hypothetical protein MLD52_01340 [Puniceicoccaceae bacterium K14]|nr:hypothetical protein [Puniceicoccaceae bacterium K14]